MIAGPGGLPAGPPLKHAPHLQARKGVTHGAVSITELVDEGRP